MIAIVSIVQLHLTFFAGVLSTSYMYDKNLQLSPNDPVVCTSQNITIVCKDLSLNTTPLYFTVTCVANINRTQVNETAYEITLLSVKHSARLSCCRGDCSDNKNHTEQFLTVSKMPEQVTDFQCVLYREKEADIMNCIWNLAASYDDTMKVTLQWQLIGISDWTYCPQPFPTYCTWPVERLDEITEEFNFTVVIESKLRITIQSNYVINPKNIWKPAPATDLHTRVDNSSCVTVMWNTTYEDPLLPSIYYIDYTSNWGNGTKTAHNKMITLCELHPSTNYTITVYVKSQMGFLIDPVATIAQTHQNVPAKSPEVNNGGYTWNPLSCLYGDNQRDTCIYWKPVPEKFRNGILTATQVVFEPSGQTYNVTVDDTYACYTLKCSQDYNISIYASNANGTSVNGSTLYIPKAQTSLPLVYFIETANEPNHNVYINLMPHATKVKAYTVFWCKKEYRNCARNSPVEWNTSEGTQSQMVLNNMNEPELYLYGVFMETENGNSVLSWQSCIYTHDVGMNTKTIVGLAVGGLLVLFLAIVGSVCLFRFCVKIGKKILTVNIYVPNAELEPHMYDKVQPHFRQDSQDSGLPDCTSINFGEALMFPETDIITLPTDYVSATITNDVLVKSRNEEQCSGKDKDNYVFLIMVKEPLASVINTCGDSESQMPVLITCGQMSDNYQESTSAISETSCESKIRFNAGGLINVDYSGAHHTNENQSLDNNWDGSKHAKCRHLSMTGTQHGRESTYSNMNENHLLDEVNSQGIKLATDHATNIIGIALSDQHVMNTVQGGKNYGNQFLPASVHSDIGNHCVLDYVLADNGFE